MTAYTLPRHTFSPPVERRLQSHGYLVEDTASGYLIDPLQPVAIKCLAVQFCAVILGALMAAFGIGLLVVASPDHIFASVGAAIGSCLVAAGLIRFGTSGLTPRIEVDLVRSELRELVVQRNGTITVLARHPFDTLGAVHTDRTAGRSASLCVRFRNRSGRIDIARGTPDELEGLRNRLGRDLHR